MSHRIPQWAYVAVLIAVALLAFPVIASADLVGDCYDCHTMHNSQGGSLMANINSGTGPNVFLSIAEARFLLQRLKCSIFHVCYEEFLCEEVFQ